MTALISKSVRIAGACAVLALTVFSMAPKPAEACFDSLDYATDCVAVVSTWCSYNGDGTGGLYRAKQRIYRAC